MTYIAYKSLIFGDNWGLQTLCWDAEMSSSCCRHPGLCSTSTCSHFLSFWSLLLTQLGDALVIQWKNTDRWHQGRLGAVLHICKLRTHLQHCIPVLTPVLPVSPFQNPLNPPLFVLLIRHLEGTLTKPVYYDWNAMSFYYCLKFSWKHHPSLYRTWVHIPHFFPVLITILLPQPLLLNLEHEV